MHHRPQTPLQSAVSECAPMAFLELIREEYSRRGGGFQAPRHRRVWISSCHEQRKTPPIPHRNEGTRLAANRGEHFSRPSNPRSRMAWAKSPVRGSIRSDLGMHSCCFWNQTITKGERSFISVGTPAFKRQFLIHPPKRPRQKALIQFSLPNGSTSGAPTFPLPVAGGTP